MRALKNAAMPLTMAMMTVAIPFTMACKTAPIPRKIYYKSLTLKWEHTDSIQEMMTPILV